MLKLFAVALSALATGMALGQGTIRQLPPPAWMADASIYQIFVRNFTPEGTLKAATARLESVRDLGVNTVYLLPFHPTGQQQRKGELGSPYSVRDYLTVDPAQGSLEDFDTFLSKAHGLGLRVVMDLVFNHTAWDNPLTLTHPEYYLKNAAGKIRAPRPEWSDVAALDTSRPDVQDYLISVGKFWARAGVDGFRADVSGDLPLNFWQRFRNALKSEYPDLLLLAETGAPAIHDRAFDLSYDWEGASRVKATLAGVGRANRLFDHFANEGGVPKLRYLENHDQPRIAAGLDLPRLRAAAAILLTQPGVPLIYAGQEVGLSQQPSLFDRDPLDWSAGHPELRAWYRRLLEARKRLEPLRRGGLRLISGQPARLLAFTRHTEREKVVVLINLSGVNQTARLPWAKTWRSALDERSFPGGNLEVRPFETLLLLDR
ncbi:glycosidase [Deinobacterium chartae]|uniref:Glycosidase n=1 Tax=Deinobacterium chartae TaxID=521158 RepID=A0A841I0I8_9DEIO|nr:alpha-amylase family glycosyl hydrolase [Deinobacterium chartae]MBB6098616.1 glycosidase [Deinobacterium chartae]